MSKVWKIVIRPDAEEPDAASGWAIAESEAEALMLAGNCTFVDDTIGLNYFDPLLYTVRQRFMNVL